MTVWKYLPCGCGLLTEGGRDYCPDCAGKLNKGESPMTPEAKEMKVTVVFENVVEGTAYTDDALKVSLANLIHGDPEAFVQSTIAKALNSLSEEEYEPATHLGIRVVSSKTPKHGWALKCGRHFPGHIGVIAGFCGDLDDFKMTLVHELLHYLRWDEVSVENKAKELLGGSNGHTG